MATHICARLYDFGLLSTFRIDAHGGALTVGILKKIITPDRFVAIPEKHAIRRRP